MKRHKTSIAYLLKATEVNLLPELEVQTQIPPVFTHQRGTQTAFLHCQVREHLKIHNNERQSYLVLIDFHSIKRLQKTI